MAVTAGNIVGTTRLQGKVAVVTAGAGAGIGGSVVERLHREGAIVHVSDANEKRLQRMADRLGIASAVVDVTAPDDLERHLQEVEAQHGRIDILVNCAGRSVIKPIEDVSLDEWRSVFAINVESCFRAARTVLPGMKAAGRGSIVSIASIAAWNTYPNEVLYSVSKAALVALTRALAQELAPSGVRVNAVAPSLIENPFLDRVYPAERVAELRAAMPRGRGIAATQVASVVAFLASDDAEGVTGETVLITDGQITR